MHTEKVQQQQHNNNNNNNNFYVNMVEIKANALDPQVAKEKSGKRYVLKSLAF